MTLTRQKISVEFWTVNLDHWAFQKSSDMRDIHEAMRGWWKALLAMFFVIIQKYIGQYYCFDNGADAIIFYSWYRRKTPDHP